MGEYEVGGGCLVCWSIEVTLIVLCGLKFDATVFVSVALILLLWVERSVVGYGDGDDIDDCGGSSCCCCSCDCNDCDEGSDDDVSGEIRAAFW
jgi:hypothetical protein